MNENTFVDNFFFHFNVFLSHYESHYEIIRYMMKLLVATFVEINLKKENLRSVLWVPKLVYQSPKWPGYIL